MPRFRVPLQVGAAGWVSGGIALPPHAVVHGVPADIDVPIQAVEYGYAAHPWSPPPLWMEYVPSLSRLTASGLAFSGPCEYSGIVVSELDGGPQTVFIYDGLSANGAPIDTIVIDGPGTWRWDRDHDGDDRGGTGGRRVCVNGCYAEISGGLSRLIDVIVDSGYLPD